MLAAAWRREASFVTHRISLSAWPDFAAVIAFALTLSLGSPGVSAQEPKAGPLPPGVAACDFGALANDRTPEGLNIRAEPGANSAILGRLPVLENLTREKVAADFRVVGVSRGWFLIEGARYGDYDLHKKIAPVYAGRGWVSGKLLTTQLRFQKLKAAPDENAADVGEVFDDYGVTAILDCKGDWLRVEAPLATKDDAAKPNPPSGPGTVLRGWTHGVCVNQRTTCGG
jgi:hypothetical protein